MKLRHRLMLYLFLMHGVFLAIVFVFLINKPLIMIAAELGLVISLLFGIYLTRKALQPTDFALQFQDLLHDKNYAARIRASSNNELNDTVLLFNRMLEALYQERIRLGEQRGFLDRLLEATPTSVIVFDFEGKISLCNTSAKNLFKIEMLGSSFEQILQANSTLQSHIDPAVPPYDNTQHFITALDQLAVGDSALISDQEGRRYRCQRNQFIDRGFNRDFLLIDEITAELASSEKSTYEKLVRVLAHEVNNTVAATGSVLESLLFYRDQLNAEDKQDFCTAIAAVQRRNTNLGEFIDRFTQVVKMPDPILRSTDVGDLLDSLIALYRQQCLDNGIQLKWRQHDVIPMQMLDSHLFEQALMNIVKNAIEAVIAGRKNRPELAHEAAYVHLNLHGDSGTKSINLSIIDSGKGLQEIPNGQLFTPFFTTKKGGQGIGLLFVREVFNRHGFAHRLAENAQGETQFDVWL
jgi:two-component system nitrogen regulation sensor histidine kinase NtrY